MPQKGSTSATPLSSSSPSFFLAFHLIACPFQPLATPNGRPDLPQAKLDGRGMDGRTDAYRSATPVTDVERVRLPAVVTCITRCPRIHPHASNPVDHPAYHARRIRTVLHQMKTKTHLLSFSPAQPSSAPPRPSTFSTSIPPANDILRVLANICIWHLTILQSLRWNYDPGQSKLEIRCDVPVKTSSIYSKKSSQRRIWSTSPEDGFVL